MKFAFSILIVFISVNSFSQDYSLDLINSDAKVVKNKVINYFFESGIGIQTIDMETGLFMSTEQNFFRSWIYSDKKKAANDSAAVILKYKTGLQPLTVTGRIMIRVSDLGVVGTKLTVKLVDIEAMSDKSMDADWRYMYSSSSGYLEEKILNYIKKSED